MGWWMLPLETNHAQNIDRDIYLHSINVDDIGPPTVKPSDAQCHASLLSSFLLKTSSYYGVSEMISSQGI